jgi:hypothetical protein
MTDGFAYPTRLRRKAEASSREGRRRLACRPGNTRATYEAGRRLARDSGRRVTPRKGCRARGASRVADAGDRRLGRALRARRTGFGKGRRDHASRRDRRAPARLPGAASGRCERRPRRATCSTDSSACSHSAARTCPGSWSKTCWRSSPSTDRNQGRPQHDDQRRPDLRVARRGSPVHWLAGAAGVSRHVLRRPSTATRRRSATTSSPASRR